MMLVLAPFSGPVAQAPPGGPGRREFDSRDCRRGSPGAPRAAGPRPPFLPEPPPHPGPRARGACGHLGGRERGARLDWGGAGRRRKEGRRGLPEPAPPESPLPRLPLLCGRPSLQCPGLGAQAGRRRQAGAPDGS